MITPSKIAIGALSFAITGSLIGAGIMMFGSQPQTEPEPTPSPETKIEVPIVNAKESEVQPTPAPITIPAATELPATAIETPPQTTTYSTYCNAPKAGPWSAYSDEEFCSQAQWLKDNGVETEEKYVARYNGVCPEEQPQNIHSAEWVYYAAVGGRIASYPAPEHYAETAWNEWHQGRLTGVWRASTFTNLGLANTLQNRQTALYIDVNNLKAYWETIGELPTSYPTEWDSYVQRVNTRLQTLETTLLSHCQ